MGERLFFDAGLRYLLASGVEMELPADTARTIEADYSPLTLTLSLGRRF